MRNAIDALQTKLMVLFLLAVVGTLNAQRMESVPGSRAPNLNRANKWSVPMSSDPRLQTGHWKPGLEVNWGAFDAAAYIAEDKARAGIPGIPFRIGVNRPSPLGLISADTHGSWEAGGKGGRVWTLEIRSPEAKGMRLHFGVFDLPPGATLNVTDRELSVIETYRNQGPYDDPGFWSGELIGDTAYIEYVEAAGAEYAPNIVIYELSHIYKDRSVFGQPIVVGGVETGGLLPCHEDPNCHGADANARDAVGQMTYTIAGQGTFVCSGAILNDTDPNTFKGYFLTANHCVSTQTVINTLQIRWQYGTNVCGGGVFSGPVTTGGTLLATSTTTDFTLLRMASDPESGQGFAAWNSTAVGNNGVTVRGIHHPNGSWKRYSSGTTTSVGQICAGRPIANYLYNDYPIGMIEGGSSGSPIFNSNWEVVGQCNGICTSVGLPDCDTPLTSYNLIYGRFSAEFASISSFLTTITPDDAYEDNDTFLTPAALPAGSHGLILIDFHDYFRVSVCGNGTLSATATFLTSQMDLDMYLYDSAGVTLDTSLSASGTENVSVPVTTGDYIVYMLKDNGWGGNYTLNVVFDPTNDCDNNNLDDACELAAGGPDCNSNSVLDACDIVSATSTDCDNNDVPDECDLASGGPDCNANNELDACDIVNDVSTDCDHNSIPDECDLAAGGADCNSNSTLDDCDVLNETSTDCNANEIPDECDVAGGAPDCNANTILDDCDLIAGTSTDCNANDTPDECDLAGGAPDCNENEILDACDLIAGSSTDCNANTVLDECDLAAGAPDCDGNEIIDSCDIAGGAPDCDTNSVLDECDLAAGAPDCNANLIPDACDVTSGLDTDCNGNLVLDDCEAYCQLFGDVVDASFGPTPDCQVDVSDLLCVLDDFEDPASCAGMGDLVTTGGGCTPDTVYDVDDLLSEIDAFAGVFACAHPCPP